MSRPGALALALVLGLAAPAAADGMAPARISACGSDITVEFGDGHLELTRAQLLAWVSRSACAVATYYGRFPVPRYRVRIEPVGGGWGVAGGTTWGWGVPHSRIELGEHAGQSDLDQDWVMTHEMTHLAFPTMPDEQHWIEEGLATYVEPLARSWIGWYPAQKVWSDLVNGLPKGIPRDGDQGLDRTHTWGRTYWGGALFCTLADLEIRRRTHGARGLIDAQRALLAAGGNIAADWSIERALHTADQGVGVPVLEELYAKMKDAPYAPDLDGLWKRLGVKVVGGSAVFDDSAPEAPLRREISARPTRGPTCEAVKLLPQSPKAPRGR